MSSILDKIKQELIILPLKDHKLCLDFIETRKIDSLKEIVDANVIKTTKQLKKNSNLQCEEDLEKLNLLKDKVDEYYKACGYNEELYIKEDLEIDDDDEYYGEY